MGCSVQVGVRIEHDEEDDNGQTVRWADTEFAVEVILEAVGCWDSGEPFCPNSAFL